MDIKYAYYNTSKGYKVTGGTAAQFLKADGSLDSTEYINRNSEQTIDSTKTVGFQNTIYSGWNRSSVANPQMGPISLLNLALQGAYPLYGDEEFRNGTNNIAIYNNAGNGNVTMIREAAANLPNRSGMQLRFNYNGNGADPGLGGFIIGFIARANAVFIQKFMAKLPVGYTFNNAENYMGANASVNWLTSKAGTGKWETYVRAVICGTGTGFSNGGHVYVTGPNTAMEFSLAFAEIYEVNSSVFSKIKEAFYVKNETIHFNGAISDLITVGDSYAQKKLLSTSWDGNNGDQVILRVPGNQDNGAYLRYSQNGILNGNISALGSNSLAGSQVFSSQGNMLLLGNTVLSNMVFQTTTNTQFNYPGAGSLYTFDVNGVYSERNINFNKDNTGINLYGDSKIYKKAGGGVYINRGNNELDPRVESADGSKSWMIFHEGNFNSSGYVTQVSLNSQLTNYAALNGNQTFTNTNTFTKSPVIPNGTLGTHAVNKSQIQLNADPEIEGGQKLEISGNNSVNLTNFFVTSRDGSRNPDDIAPNSTGRRVRFDFINAGSAGLKAAGNYAGVMTYAPFDGTTASTGDSSYQLAFANQTGMNGSGIPMLKMRKGIDGGWSKTWYKFWTDGDFSGANIQQWNYMAQNGIQLNSEFTIHTGSGLLIADNSLGSGIVDKPESRLVAVKKDEYYFYGSKHETFDGLNFNWKNQSFGMGMEANIEDKLTVEGSVKASGNFKSKDEKPDTIFIPNGRLATLTNEIVNDQSDKYYAIRLEPREYEMNTSYLSINDKNRLIHIIGQSMKMAVNLEELYPKQQIVIYNFDQNNGYMDLQLFGNRIYTISGGSFLRLYVTESRRIIIEREQACKFIP